MAKILVVEDNELNMKLFCDLLISQNYEVLISRSGLDACEIAMTHHPDAILMDIQLGHISGIDLIKQLKANASTQSIPIIAVTALAMRTDEALIYSSGCDFYLSKPVYIDDFLATLERFIKPVELR